MTQGESTKEDSNGHMDSRMTRRKSGMITRLGIIAVSMIAAVTGSVIAGSTAAEARPGGCSDARWCSPAAPSNPPPLHWGG